MAEFFYSPSEKTVFWMAGYQNHFDVNKLIESLKNGRRDFVRMFPSGTRFGDIYTDTVMKSHKYKNYRFYWTKIDREPPADAYSIGNSWNMNDWIKGYRE